ncbi:mucin-2-like, partial [Saccostrea cucullata]|uniref:mucin-2-like n=1 Tax=Saccostrea cuccullata TaxID=36930 RepID=UPI002ED444C7
EPILEFPDKKHNCQGLLCIFGRLLKIDNYQCIQNQHENSKKSLSQNQFTLTTYPPALSSIPTLQTSPNYMCHYNGKWYMPGEMIEQGQSGNWCYFTQCSDTGHVISGDNFNCGTTYPTTIPPTTTPFLTTTPAITTTTTSLVITPMYCFFKDPTTQQMVVWRGGTTDKLSDGTVCRCEYWGRLSCPENNVGK